MSGRQFRDGGEEYLTGDTLEVSERAYEGWKARLEPTDDGEDQSDEDNDSNGEAEESDGLDPHPGDLTVDELEDRISGVDDPDLLQRIRDTEEAADDRSGALDAIDARLNDLDEGEDSEGEEE